MARRRVATAALEQAGVRVRVRVGVVVRVRVRVRVGVRVSHRCARAGGPPGGGRRGDAARGGRAHRAAPHPLRGTRAREQRCAGERGEVRGGAGGVWCLNFELQNTAV